GTYPPPDPNAANFPWDRRRPAGPLASLFQPPEKTRCNSLISKPLSKPPRFYVFSGCMGRKLRYIPDGGALVEVTCRTLQGRLLLRPSPELNDIAAGILGRAQRLYPVKLILYSLSSNHYHLIVWTETAKR